MTTIKLKLDNEIDILKEQRSFNNIVRLSFNRCQDGFSEKEIRGYLKDRFIGANSWFVQCGIRVANQLFQKHNDKRIVFGGRHNLTRYLKKQITKEEFKSRRLLPITIQGEQLHGGNRMFNFDFPNNKMVFKLSRDNHIDLSFKPPHKKLKNNLIRLQELIDNRQITITVSLTGEFVCLTFDETKILDCNFRDLKKNRILGLDLNPNYIGLSVLEFNGNNDFKVLNKQVFDLSKLNGNPGVASSDVKSKHLKNKRHHEIIHIAHDIARLVDYWKCDKVAIEELSMKSSDKGFGKRFNRLCNNVWNRRLFTMKLKSLGLLCNFAVIEVNPCYSSFIGNVVFGNGNTPDMVAASVEIARRGYRKFDRRWFYPSIKDERIDERWKQTLSGFDDWKSAFMEVKKSKVKYRFQLLDCVQNAVFSKFYRIRQMKLYVFV